MQLQLLILMFILQTRVICDKPCGMEHVSAAEGGKVILRVPRSEDTIINWILLPSGTVVATTEPGKSIDEKAVRKEYKGRVSSEDDGSLHIYHLSLKDQRVYKAQTINDEICVEFNLTVYEKLLPGDIKINHSLTSNDTCALGLLCLVDKQHVNVTWSTARSDNINVTRGVLYVPPSDVNFTHTCTARNPVSNVSKTVIPVEYCRKGGRNLAILGQRSHYGLIFIIIAISIIIIIIAVPAVFRYVRRKKRKSQKDEVTTTVITTYAEVVGLPRQLENPDHESQGEKQGALTVYSEVQYSKKRTNSPKELPENEVKPVETVYSSVSLPKQTTNSQKKLAEKKADPVESVYSTVSLPKA